jgi:hypothetical protein
LGAGPLTTTATHRQSHLLAAPLHSPSHAWPERETVTLRRRLRDSMMMPSHRLCTAVRNRRSHQLLAEELSHPEYNEARLEAICAVRGLNAAVCTVDMRLVSWFRSSWHISASKSANPCRCSFVAYGRVGCKRVKSLSNANMRQPGSRTKAEDRARAARMSGRDAKEEMHSRPRRTHLSASIEWGRGP